MSEVMKEMQDSLAKIGKQWDLGESVGRVWGFLLFKFCPVTQREIEEGTGYSRGLVSRSLKRMEQRSMIEVERDGREMRYSANTSLADGFGELMKHFLTWKGSHHRVPFHFKYGRFTPSSTLTAMKWL